MRVQATKIQDLARGTHSRIADSTAMDPDRTGPIVAKDRKQIWVGELRRFKGWFGKWALHESATSLDHAFRYPGSRLIIRGPVQLVTGPVADYKVFSNDVVEERTKEYDELSQRREVKAVVRTLNSVYEVQVLPNKEYVEKVLGPEAVARAKEIADNEDSI